jgi:hypothetical protein
LPPGRKDRHGQLDARRLGWRAVPRDCGALNSPLRWGTQAGLDELLGRHVTSLQVTRRTFAFRFRSAEHWLELFRTYYGPTRRAFEALDGSGKRALARDLTDVLHWFNRSDDETIVVPGDYLEVVAIRR